MEKLVNISDIELGVDASCWQDAVKKTGEILVREGRVKSEYIDDMIETVENLGPYIVLCPGLAMPHARPGGNVIKSGVGIITLSEPINFGNRTNDPVKVVVGLAGINDNAHVKVVQRIAEVFEDETMIDYFATCNDRRIIMDIFNGKEIKK